jgi:lipid-A-disaccharide synthase
VILIDYPGFNWWIAWRAKRHRIPVFYYGAPQMWAWASWRIHKMRRLVDHVLCKLPFEADWYRRRNCRATFVGHPYFDELHRQKLDASFVADQQRRSGSLVTILPGSRDQEVQANLAPFLAAAAEIHRRAPHTRFAIAAFHLRQAEWARHMLSGLDLPIEVHVGRTGELIHCATACMACSGSVSLELLFHEKPSVIHYRIGRFAFWVQRFFRRVRFITLVNLLASEDRYCDHGELYEPHRDRVPFPEYLTCTDVAQQMAGHVSEWLVDATKRQQVTDELRRLNAQLSSTGASVRAAQYIMAHARTSPSVRTHYIPQARAA